jgi:CRP-like cAMP-binding protein
MQALARRMFPLTTTRGSHIAEQGSEAEHIYFLQRGTVEILHLGRPVGRLYAPSVVGEAALLKHEMDHAGTRLSGYRTTSTAMCAPPSFALCSIFCAPDLGSGMVQFCVPVAVRPEQLC